MIKAFSASLSLRLLGIFIVTALLIIALLVGLFSQGLKGQWRRSIQPHLEQYVLYVQQDLGSPPKIEQAESLAQRIPVDIYIYRGDDFIYSTTSLQLPLDTIIFRSKEHGRTLAYSAEANNVEGFRRPTSRLTLQRPAIGRSDTHTRILRIQDGDYSVYYDLRGQGPFRGKHGNEMLWALLALALVLGGSYLAIRRQLSPIRQIQKSVGRMANEELDHRINRKGAGDLDVLAQSIDDMAEHLQAMLDAKRQLLMAISHELRSPLTRARITTELLPESRNRERLMDDLKDIERMITDIMESERLQANHSVLNLSSVDVSMLFGNELYQLAPDIQLQQQEPDQPIMLTGDPTRLRILLRNLIVNALQHGRSSDGNTILNVILSENTTHIKLQVNDEGPGIPHRYLEQITEPFYRPDASRSRITGGFGLGLTLAKLIAEAHSGTLNIESDTEIRPGTRITVTLPKDPTRHN